MIGSTIDKLCPYRLPVIRYRYKQSEDDFVIDYRSVTAVTDGILSVTELSHSKWLFLVPKQLIIVIISVMITRSDLIIDLFTSTVMSEARKKNFTMKCVHQLTGHIY